MKLRFLILSMLSGLVLAVLVTAPALAAYADPSGRVARVSYLDGDVSFSPAGEEEWVRAIINRPLIRGDRLWADRRSRVELQLGAAAVRLDQLSSAEILDLDDNYAQFFLAEGSLNIYVRRIWEGQVYEIATPTLALVIRQPGSYRIDVDANGRHTDVTVWQGGAEAYGERASFNLRQGEKVRFYDTSLRDYRLLGSPRTDNFDSFAFDRDRLMDSSPSLRYVSDDLIGYTDLDRYGRWSTHREYGAVWYPSRVSSGWAPYRHGHWSWIEPFGWTWVDDAAWGFAVSHYGRWVYVGNRWGWIPSPRTYRAVYAPALVAFVGGSNWSLSFSSGVRPVGWFPLGPRDVWFPSYRVSSNYFARVNVHNTVINNVTVVNVYNNYYVRGGNLSQVTYQHRQNARAHTVVSQDVFTGGRSVQQGLISAARGSTARGEVQRLAPVAPTARSLVGTAQAAKSTPTREVFQRQAVTSRAPAATAATVPFRTRQEALQRQPGEPLAVQPRQAQATAAPVQQRPLRVVGRDAAPIDRQQVSGRTSETPRAATQREQAAPARRPPATPQAAPQGSDAAQPVRSAPARSAAPGRSDAAQPAGTQAPRPAPARAESAAPRSSPATVQPRSTQPAPQTAPRQVAPARQPAQRSVEPAAPQVAPRSSTPTQQAAPPARQPAQRNVQPAAPQVAPRSSAPTRQSAPAPAPRQQAIQTSPQQEQRARQADLQRQSVERARQSQQQQAAPRTQPARQSAPPQQRTAPPARQQAEDADAAPQRAAPRQRGRDDRGL